MKRTLKIMKNHWQIVNNILKIMKNHWMPTRIFLRGFRSKINKVRMPRRFLTRYVVFLEIHVFPPRWHYNFRLYHIMKKSMKHNENHRQNNENPMKTNGSTHDQKMTKYAQKNAISSSADPRTPRLLTSNMYVHIHILCNIYSAYVYVCVKCRFRRLPSCLINISLSWGISWENPCRAF